MNTEYIKRIKINQKRFYELGKNGYSEFSHEDQIFLTNSKSDNNKILEKSNRILINKSKLIQKDNMLMNKYISLSVESNFLINYVCNIYIGTTINM